VKSITNLLPTGLFVKRKIFFVCAGKVIREMISPAEDQGLLATSFADVALIVIVSGDMFDIRRVQALTLRIVDP
jgi:hypothetical protein